MTGRHNVAHEEDVVNSKARCEVLMVWQLQKTPKRVLEASLVEDPGEDGSKGVGAVGISEKSDNDQSISHTLVRPTLYPKDSEGSEFCVTIA